ncbi:MAG: DUF2236 domain-containing protein [Proteobacteria bacterium]|nr:DUF2236 domain-containing protein [Pseudomonadota bacterium]
MQLDDAFLDGMRRRGDPPADHLIEVFFRLRQEAADGDPVRSLMTALVEKDELEDEDFPAELRRFLEANENPLHIPAETIRAGQRVFAEHGPEIMLLLGCYSLPAAYAANAGVQVLAQTHYLASHPLRRLLETAQMIINVMRPGGLDHDGNGTRTAKKVRLMHAAVRHLILTKPDRNWDVEALGVPINQEDLAGTLMTFAYVTLDGLRQLGVRVDPEAQESYLAAWAAVGQLMGVETDLIPRSIADADALTRKIQSRQIQVDVPNPDGVALTRALLDMLQDHIPGRILDHSPASLMRYLLPRPVADQLEIPRRPFSDWLVRCWARLVGWLDRVWLGSRRRRRSFRRQSVGFIQAVIDFGRGGKRATFDVPTQLRRDWDVP